MEYYDNLLQSRKNFLIQLSNLINSQFEEQKNLTDEENDYEKTLKELENNSNYIQRIFIDAPWGMGKSYFGESLKEYLLEKEVVDKVEKINVWETDYFSDPMKSLIGEFKEKEILEKNVISVAEKLLSLNWKNVLKKAGPVLFSKTATIVANYLKCDENTIKEINNLPNKFITGIEETKFPEIGEFEEYKESVSTFKKELNKDKKKKVIIIDELDRCRPDYAISMLEVIKHFFGVKNIIFIFLVNKTQLKNTVLTLFLKEDKREEYFEKFFDIEFELPTISYTEYIEREYKKYYDFNFYEIDEYNTSNKKELLFEKNLLDILQNYDSDKILISLRGFIKSFKKFKVLIQSLEEEEKNIYPLILCLIIYFYFKEFNIENNNNESKLTNNPIDIYLSIFEKVFKNMNTYLHLVNSLLLRNSIKSSEKLSKVKVCVPLISGKEEIYFNNLYYNIFKEDTDILCIPQNIISNIDSMKINAIWDWCKIKYQFASKIIK